MAAYESMFIFLIVSRHMDHSLRIHFIGRQQSETARAQKICGLEILERFHQYYDYS